MATVRLEHVWKKFGRNVVLKGLDLAVEDKELLVMLGPSGCGKTTALRLIAGLEEVNQGELYIGDRRVNDVEPMDRDIAMVFQSFALYPHMTVYDNMAFGLQVRGTAEKEVDRRVHEAAQILDIGELLDRRPDQLSGGQKQRVALGRALVRDAGVFLLDEPLGSLDAKLRVHMRGQIVRLHQRVDTTMIYVTHDQVEAMTIGDRIAVMEDGIIQQLGAPEDLYDRPQNLFVAGFIGSPPMNLFPMSLVHEDDRLLVRHEQFQGSLSSRDAALLSSFDGTEVVVGLRSEALDDAGQDEPRPGDAVVSAEVDLVESLGNERLIHLVRDGRGFVARVDLRTRMKVGDAMQAIFRMDQAHLFDPRGGRRLN